MTNATVFFEFDPEGVEPHNEHPYAWTVYINVEWEALEFDIESEPQGYKFPPEFGNMEDRYSILYHFEWMIREITEALPWFTKFDRVGSALEIEIPETDPDEEIPTSAQLDTIRRVCADAKRSYASRLDVVAAMRPDSNADGL